MKPTCGACGKEVPIEVDLMVYRLLRFGLGEARKAALATIYGGIPPDTLDAACFLTTLGVLNGASDVRSASQSSVLQGTGA